MSDAQPSRTRAATATRVVATTVRDVLISANLALSAWLVAGRVTDLPWFSGEPGPRCDFIVRYAAGWLARSGQAAKAYDAAAYQATQAQFLPGFNEGMLWMHPPPALLLWTPLSALPYAWAYLLWFAISTVAFLWVIRRIVGHPLSLVAAPLFAGFVLDFAYAQDGAFLTALLGAGLLAMPSRPALAGIPLGYILIKPQWAPMILVALVAGRKWRTLAVTLAVAGSLCSVSILTYGVGIWREWFGQLDAGLQLIQVLGIHDIMSPYAALLPFNAGGAVIAQAICTTVASCGVAWVWFQDRSVSTRVAVLTVAMSIASPYLHFYDLAVLALAVAWLAREALDAGNPSRAVLLFALATSSIWLGRMIGALFFVQVLPWLLLLAFGFLLRRRDPNCDEPSPSVV